MFGVYELPLFGSFRFFDDENPVTFLTHLINPDSLTIK